MATTKKTHTTKKAPVKKAGVHKNKVKSAPAPLTWRFYSVTIGIFLVAVTAVVVIAFLANSILVSQNNSERLDRIKAIYKSLNIDETAYVPTYVNVFGDKRPYEGAMSGQGRTFSSEIDYIHGDTVSNTVSELNAKIKAAGFTFEDEPYPGTTSVQYHYKSANGEWIRLTVNSKPYDDAFFNYYQMGQEVPDSVYAMDKNAGPSKVIIKVNLDDNNE